MLKREPPLITQSSIKVTLREFYLRRWTVEFTTGQALNCVLACLSVALLVTMVKVISLVQFE